VFVPVTLMVWKSSGRDSGPPSESFLVFFVRWAADPLAAIYPVAGQLTAGFTGGWVRGVTIVSPDYAP
jgi:hypothetical protein